MQRFNAAAEAARGVCARFFATIARRRPRALTALPVAGRWRSGVSAATLPGRPGWRDPCRDCGPRCRPGRSAPGRCTESPSTQAPARNTCRRGHPAVRLPSAGDGRRRAGQQLFGNQICLLGSGAGSLCSKIYNRQLARRLQVDGNRPHTKKTRHRGVAYNT